MQECAQNLKHYMALITFKYDISDFLLVYVKAFYSQGTLQITKKMSSLIFKNSQRHLQVNGFMFTLF